MTLSCIKPTGYQKLCAVAQYVQSCLKNNNIATIGQDLESWETQTPERNLAMFKMSLHLPDLAPVWTRIVQVDSTHIETTDLLVWL